MAINVGSSPVQQVFVGSSPVREVWVGSELVWQSVVYLSGDDPGSQLIDALTARGLDYRTVTELPFGLDTSQVTDMSYMFWGYQALTTVPAMDTSQVTDMSRMFFNCSALTAVPDMDTSQVTNMSNMFFGCSSLTAVPDMDTSQVTNMSNMFRNCSSLTQVPDLDASSVTDTSYMFYGCSSLVDGSVRLIRPDGTLPATQTSMITYSGLTREPFFLPDGKRIPEDMVEVHEVSLTNVAGANTAHPLLTVTVPAGETWSVRVQGAMTSTFAGYNTDPRIRIGSSTSSGYKNNAAVDYSGTITAANSTIALVTAAASWSGTAGFTGTVTIEK